MILNRKSQGSYEIFMEKGEVYNVSGGPHDFQYRYEGGLDDGNKVQFRIGDFGWIGRFLVPSVVEVLNMGEFAEIGNTGVGLTPLELIAKGAEEDFILKVRFGAKQTESERSGE